MVRESVKIPGLSCSSHAVDRLRRINVVYVRRHGMDNTSEVKAIMLINKKPGQAVMLVRVLSLFTCSAVFLQGRGFFSGCCPR